MSMIVQVNLLLCDSSHVSVDWEYFSVTKATWAKCLMSFNFVNLAGT